MICVEDNGRLQLNERLFDEFTLPSLIEVVFSCNKEDFIDKRDLLAVEKFREHSESMAFEMTLGIIDEASVKLNSKTSAAIMNQCLNKVKKVNGYQWELVEVDNEGKCGTDSSLVLCLLLLEYWIKDEDKNDISLLSVIRELFDIYDNNKIRNVSSDDVKAEYQDTEEGMFEEIKEFMKQSTMEDVAYSDPSSIKPNKAVSMISFLLRKLSEISSGVFLRGTDMWLLIEGVGYDTKGFYRTQAGYYCHCIVRAQIKLIKSRIDDWKSNDVMSRSRVITSKSYDMNSSNRDLSENSSHHYSFIKKQTPQVDNTSLRIEQHQSLQRSDIGMSLTKSSFFSSQLSPDIYRSSKLKLNSMFSQKQAKEPQKYKHNGSTGLASQSIGKMQQNDFKNDGNSGSKLYDTLKRKTSVSNQQIRSQPSQSLTFELLKKKEAEVYNSAFLPSIPSFSHSLKDRTTGYERTLMAREKAAERIRALLGGRDW